MNITRFMYLSSKLRQGCISVGYSKGHKLFINDNNSACLNQNNVYNQQWRSISTYEVKKLQSDTSLLKRILQKIPGLNIDDTRLRVTAYLFYERIADTFDYEDIFETFDLPDTFYSWFVIMELYIWMLSVRCMADDKLGRLFRNYLVEALWTDVTERAKRLHAGNNSAMKNQIMELSEQLQASFIAYDEGLQSTDMVLAGALWRRMYGSEEVNINHLEILVKYIRKQLLLLDNVASQEIFIERELKWEHLNK